MTVYLKNREVCIVLYTEPEHIQNQRAYSKRVNGGISSLLLRFIVLPILCPPVSRCLNSTHLFILKIHLILCSTTYFYFCYI